MCARFEQTLSGARVARRFGLAVPPEVPGGEVRPTDPALAVTRGRDGGAVAGRLRFGLTVDWRGGPVINARAETLADRPTFRPLLGQRCVVPVSAWIEWRVDTAGGRHLNRLAGPQMLPLAALWRGRELVIVTCAASPSVAGVHDRMPVVLADDGAAWTDPGRDFAEVAGLLVPYPGPLSITEAPPAQGALF